MVTIRSLHTTLRQLPTHSLFRKKKHLGQYRGLGVLIERSMGTAAPSAEPWSALPGMDHFEPSTTLALEPVQLAHGILKLSVQYRQMCKFVYTGSAVPQPASLDESFENIPSPRLFAIASPPSSLTSRPSSFKSSPETLRLGKGATSPRHAKIRSYSASQVAASPPVPAAHDSTHRRTSSIIAEPIAISPSARSYATPPVASSILGDTAVAQFMKQCENHPVLESLKAPQAPSSSSVYSDTSLRKRIERLREHFFSEIDVWLSDFRAVEALSAPARSLESSMVRSKQQTMPPISPVIEAHSESPPPLLEAGSEPESNASFSLMFPL